MGFAVVADEVRNLAQRSANAARETGDLLEGSLVLVRETSNRLNDLITASAENSRGANLVKDLVAAVGVENQQESRGIQEIAQTIPQVEEATQRVAAGAEESAAASKELNSEATRLDDVAARLERIVTGGGFQTKNDYENG
jgi:methyl-accepting chemotaxis protein